MALTIPKIFARDDWVKVSINKAEKGIIKEESLIKKIKGEIHKLETFGRPIGTRIFMYKWGLAASIGAVLSYTGSLVNIKIGPLLNDTIKLHVVIKRLIKIYHKGLEEAYKIYKLDVKFKHILAKIVKAEKKDLTKLAKEHDLSQGNIKDLHMSFHWMRCHKSDKESKKKYYSELFDKLQSRLVEEREKKEFANFIVESNECLKKDFEALEKNAVLQGENIDIILGLAHTLREAKCDLRKILDPKERDRIRMLKSNVGTRLPDIVRTINEHNQILLGLIKKEKILLQEEAKLEYESQRFTEKIDELVRKELHATF